MSTDFLHQIPPMPRPPVHVVNFKHNHPYPSKNLLKTIEHKMQQPRRKHSIANHEAQENSRQSFDMQMKENYKTSKLKLIHGFFSATFWLLYDQEDNHEHGQIGRASCRERV